MLTKLNTLIATIFSRISHGPDFCRRHGRVAVKITIAPGIESLKILELP